MGQESSCRLEFEGRTQEGKALLETSELIFRGETKLKIPFREMSELNASDGKLSFTFDARRAILHLGPSAEKWARKILNPPSRLDKLGIKPGMRIRWIGPVDKEFKQEAEEAGAKFVRSKPDLTMLHAAAPSDLKDLESPVWIVYRKGVKQLREIDVLNEGRRAGLVDIKVASFSSTHTALKFVQPRGKAIVDRQ